MFSAEPKIIEVYAQCRQELKKLYDKREADSIASLLMNSEIHNFNVLKITEPNKLLSHEEAERLFKKLDECLKFRPIQYVLGQTEFMGMTFQVDESVLIPRPETEELVNWILNEENNYSSIVDIGTGSGCIAISIAVLLKVKAQVEAWDISDRALALAERNAKENQVEIVFRKKDILEPLDSNHKFDLIVSNPPYVPASEKEIMEKNVLSYEPHQALFVEDKRPLLFYEKIIGFSMNSLVKKGALYFEIHEDYGRAVYSLLREAGFVEIEIQKDINGKDRMIRAKKIP